VDKEELIAFYFDVHSEPGRSQLALSKFLTRHLGDKETAKMTKTENRQQKTLTVRESVKWVWWVIKSYDGNDLA